MWGVGYLAGGGTALSLLSTPAEIMAIACLYSKSRSDAIALEICGSVVVLSDPVWALRTQKANNPWQE